MTPVPRCEIRHPDGRQCCRPRTHVGQKCLVAKPGPVTYETGMAIACAWGYPESMASSAVRGALSSGRPMDADRFVSMVSTFSAAIRDGLDRRARGGA